MIAALIYACAALAAAVLLGAIAGVLLGLAIIIGAARVVLVDVWRARRTRRAAGSYHLPESKP